MSFDFNESSSLPAGSNALIHEKSPYLLQHARNPVQWLPWGEAAFGRARDEDKPIFLSVGYSTCHWCHVMAHESFEDAQTAQILNESFVNIKVDREERPDVDRLYMAFVQATTGQGGWPMSVWLTPQLKPFVGGTYFPPEDLAGRVGFPTLLRRIAKAWEANRQGVMIQGSNMIEALRHNTTAEPVAADAALPGEKALDRGFEIFSQMFDPIEGGWGQAPKFPRPSVFAFLLREYARRGVHTSQGRQAAQMVLFTLGKMAMGGMHDALGGGFHRYSVDGQWHVPHFEKMLYDQAQLAIAYVEAAQVTGEEIYALVARDILDYVQRDMTDALGGFYSAEDADSLLKAGEPQHAEGAFYVWTQAQIEAALGAQEAALFNFAYNVKPSGNVAREADLHGEFSGKNILIQRLPIAAIAKEFSISASAATTRLKQSREKLLAIRSQRPRPRLDDKILTAWNGLMISAFARAFQVFDEPSYLASAQKAAAFVRKHLTCGSHDLLLRSYRKGPGSVAAFADDYAALIEGLLDLYEADFDAAWLNWAIALQEKMDVLFWDATNGGYFSTSGNDASVLLRLKEDYDGAEPSPNSVAALNLLRLCAITGRHAWRDRAHRLLRAYGPLLTQSPAVAPQMLAALDFSLGKVTQIVLRAPSDDDTQLGPLVGEIHRKFLPRKVLIHARDSATLAQAQLIDNQATAYVCVDFACQVPTNRPETLRQLLFR